MSKFSRVQLLHHGDARVNLAALSRAPKAGGLFNFFHSHPPARSCLFEAKNAPFGGRLPRVLQSPGSRNSSWINHSGIDPDRGLAQLAWQLHSRLSLQVALFA